MESLRKLSSYTIVKVVLLGALLAGLGYETQDHLRKYFDGKTGQTMRLEHSKSLALPAMTFCTEPTMTSRRNPIFLTEYMFYWFLDNGNSVPPDMIIPKSVSSRNVTYSYDDWYSSTFGLGVDFNINLFIDNHRLPKDSYKILEINTLWEGRCYTLLMENKTFMPLRDMVTILLHPTKGGDSTLNGYLVTLHEKSDIYSSVLGFWEGQGSHSFNLGYNRDNIVSLKKKINIIGTSGKTHLCHEYDGNNVDPHSFGGSMSACRLKAVAKAIHNRSEWGAKCERQLPRGPCLIPQLQDMMRFYADDLPPIGKCASLEEYNCMVSIALKAIFEVEDEGLCKTPCQSVTYDVQHRQTAATTASNIYVSIKYTSGIVSITEDYLIYDFSNILAALGGALGLFVGFSFYDCGSLIVDWLAKKSSRMRLHEVTDRELT